MTELDLILIRQREHELAAIELRIDAANLNLDHKWVMSLVFLNKDILDSVDQHIKELEQRGYDYFTITAEMARIRAELDGRSDDCCRTNRNLE